MSARPKQVLWAVARWGAWVARWPRPFPRVRLGSEGDDRLAVARRPVGFGLAHGLALDAAIGQMLIDAPGVRLELGPGSPWSAIALRCERREDRTSEH